jgi:hypothetical protein
MAVKPEGPMKTALVRGKSTVNIRAISIAQYYVSLMTVVDIVTELFAQV